MEYVLKVENLSKNFNEIKALDNINFDLKKGEIHGIIGANGSGKSTFVNILFGSKHIMETGGYEGDIFIDNIKVDIKSTYDAMKQGIGMVHQELALFGEQDISSNIKINRENIIDKTKLLGEFALVDRNKNEKDAKKALLKVGVDINPRIKVKDIPTNLKQFVEIAREVDNDKLKVLILDEPTSSLNVEETKILLSNLKAIAETGVSIIFISHRLYEIVDVCHRVTIFRSGRVIKEYKKEDYDMDKMALDMIGKEVVQVSKERKNTTKENILSFNNVEVSYGYEHYKNISLDIKKGEILGITGLAGHGQEIFGYGLMGLYDMKGDVIYKREKLIPGDTNSIIKKGIYLLPDERKEWGLLLNKSVWENIVFEAYDRQNSFLKYPALGKLSPLNYKAIRKYSNDMVEKLNIKVRDIGQKVSDLSGGNQQKVCIGRAITIDPEVLFIGEPTRGIDLYSKEIILDMLLKLNEEKNTTIIIFSGEISELKRVCDRIVVMYRNRVFKIFDDDFKSEELSLALSGRSLE
ncbi:simple sugar transport system ATP-binding protein [Keratinibaculum paraultunense]|uniref:Simple sugar transport system ATP-binding protein n=1 Tax=Keratinibaculum paraultunense TaxID=1278232 RepID=A0A4R3KVZ8_9FIRM|nr:sugar ABC transporter ATP-binding protein [Keratinibaculum paraultunense]QQY79298.1 sugar ABC transporter ATP-binding protein [Keratinibaculum paraultunense]TCS89432.1 simple sugar transport system ATP-binding protein [Keratinibaculum paraultunense]